jgi:hypothetical protein
MSHSIPATSPGLKIALLALAALVAAAGSASAQDAASLESVLRVWRERERATRSLRFELRREYLIGKESLLGAAEGGGAVAEPPSPIKANQTCVLVVDGVKMRYERIGETWIDSLKAPAPETMIAVFDGRGQKILHRRDRSDDLVHSTGFVRANKSHPDVHNLYLSPIIRHFRPVSAAFGVVKLDRLELSAAGEEVDGKRCIVLEEPQPDGLRIRKYWIVPDQDMAVVRYVGYFKGSVEDQADVTFAKDPLLGWIPDRWTAIRFGSERKILSSATTLVARKEVNVAVPPETFDVAFPPGTKVFDNTTKETYLIRP